MISTYGILGTIKMCYFFLKTKLFFQKARLIRFPIDIRNKKNIDFGENLTTGIGCRIECFPEKVTPKKLLRFGKNVQINDYVHITAANSVEIGNNVLMASKIYISDCTHGSYVGDCNDSSPMTLPIERNLSVKPVKIDDNVWLGEFVSVLPGVTIGKGTIVGANSVVSKSLPPYVIAVGSPAKPIKYYNFDTQKWEKIC
ncbi:MULTISPECIES: transferase hexapeptide repeat protein [Acinetobacter]|uniref:transferase hexapeptide repeat protein n=1 Tax=Acinetobacter TaxID=469 RepID=UPI0002AE8CD4|nr:MULTISPECIES: transferase hexapeptide repeat protein [Acinetobacter]ELW89757.1 transferase hexapeptide repeat protein [Acinetobacter sp. WC-743]MBJ8445344.1 acetyltransferase [Acinetobacter bereziniae]MBJ8476161.1 acetyltransferase [Acinetobacter bereziniae]